MKKKIKTRNQIARLIKSIRTRIVKPKKGKGPYNRKKTNELLALSN